MIPCFFHLGEMYGQVVICFVFFDAEEQGRLARESPLRLGVEKGHPLQVVGTPERLTDCPTKDIIPPLCKNEMYFGYL
jgi:hypothetical protein